MASEQHRPSGPTGLRSSGEQRAEAGFGLTVFSLSSDSWRTPRTSVCSFLADRGERADSIFSLTRSRTEPEGRGLARFLLPAALLLKTWR